MRTVDELLAEAAQHSAGNREEISASRYAGCTSCCAVFNPGDVAFWRDDWITPEQKDRIRRWTAECPRCGHATVIGSASGLLEDQGYLPIVHELALARERGEKQPGSADWLSKKRQYSNRS